MAVIKLKRGLKANLPTTLNAGEPALAIDTGELFYGDNSGNRQPIKIDKSNILNFSHTHNANQVIASINGIFGSEVQTILNNLKVYIDNAIQGLTIKEPVRVATTNLIENLYGLQTIDGVELNAGDRILVKDYANVETNGIYIVSNENWVRAPDFNSPANIKSGTIVFVQEGNINHDTGWILVSDYGDLGWIEGDFPIEFVQFTKLGQVVVGQGLNKVGNQISHNSIGTAGTYTKVTTDDMGHIISGTTLSASDIPSLDTSKITTGLMPIARGGTNNSSYTNNQLILYDGTKFASSGKTINDFAPISHVGGGGSEHALVTPSTHGFMSASDKTKLDGLPNKAVYKILFDQANDEIQAANGNEIEFDFASYGHIGYEKVNNSTIKLKINVVDGGTF
jgi:phage-related tail fiber protein